VATVRVAGGPEVTLTASDSVIPVSRKFTGATVTVGLAIGDPPTPDPRFWLGDGVVRGSGLVVTASADVAEMARLMAGVPKQAGRIVGEDDPPAAAADGVRPPLGVLVLDDGTSFPLDRDYVLGREPTFDVDVIEGRASPLRINDPDGTVSRLHLRISLVGWQVEVSDLGSANGSVLQLSGEERTLAPFAPTIIEPGTRIGIGHRSMQYVAYQGVLP
jgi:hypothetical protein